MKTVTNNCLTQITYVRGNATQIKRMVSISDYEAIIADRDIHELLTSKLQKEFVKTHKIRLNSDEVAEHSPLGKAIMGLSEGQSGIMTLPDCQGGQQLVNVVKIYESEEASDTGEISE